MINSEMYDDIVKQATAAAGLERLSGEERARVSSAIEAYTQDLYDRIIVTLQNALSDGVMRELLMSGSAE